MFFLQIIFLTMLCISNITADILIPNLAADYTSTNLPAEIDVPKHTDLEITLVINTGFESKIMCML